MFSLCKILYISKVFASKILGITGIDPNLMKAYSVTEKQEILSIDQLNDKSIVYILSIQEFDTLIAEWNSVKINILEFSKNFHRKKKKLL